VVACGELMALTHQIARDCDAIAAAGIERHHWEPSPEGDAVAMFVRAMRRRLRGTWMRLTGRAG
jgi:hypothetical protein